MALNHDGDHWDFLDEIEAPMWTDLNSEAKSNLHDISDDEWFYTTHQFHQCSSSHLKSMFLHGRDESTSLDTGLVGTSSPKLPRSVSKSRGKEYRSKKWKEEDSFNKAHPVKGLTRNSLSSMLGPGNNKAKNNWSRDSKSIVAYENSSSGKAISTSSSKHKCSGENPGKSLSSDANRTSEVNPTSTVTTSSYGVQEQIKAVEGISSSHAFGQTNELLSMMKMCLRKSYVARRATRGEIHNNNNNSNEGKQAMTGRNSSSSNKSSIGSSSNPSYGIGASKSKSVRSKEITPDSRNSARTSYVAAKAPAAAKIKEDGASNNRRSMVNNTAKQKVQCRDTRKALVNNTAKQKVQCRDTRKALAPLRVNGSNSTVAASTEIKKKGLSRNLAHEGKENVAQKKCNAAKVENVVQKKCNATKIENVTENKCDAGGDRKVVKRSVSGSVVAGTACSKGKSRGRAILEKPKSLIQRAHFR